MSATPEHILAIDLGTSGPKVALLTPHGRLCGVEFEPVGLTLLPGGGAEQDPHEWWSCIVRATRRLLARGLAPRDTIVAVSVTAQWSGTVAVDAAGEPLTNAIIWMDSRGAADVHAVTGGPLRVEGYGVHHLLRWIRLTGGIPGRAGKDPIAHILYLKRAHPELYERTHKFLEPKDYLNLRLTGRFAASYDSIVLHWVTDNRDLAAVDYHPGLLRAVGVAREKLPDLGRAVDVLAPLLPAVADELGLPRATPVVYGTPDILSAAVGSGGVRDFQGHLYVGTSSWLTCHVPFKKTDLFASMASLPSAIPGRYLIANEQETAGACLTFLRDRVLWGEGEPGGGAPANAYARLDAMAESVPAGARKLIFTPWLYGERTPVEDSTLRGGFFNLSLDARREELVRAVFEGVAFNSRWLLEAVERFAGRPFDALNMIGGGARSAVWGQIFADVLERPIRQLADPVEANARGAAFVASVALGRASFDDLAGRVEIARTLEPQPANRGVYRELFAEFKAIYKRDRRAHARLNRRD